MTGLIVPPVADLERMERHPHVKILGLFGESND
jgi:hypothetical protein